MTLFKKKESFFDGVDRIIEQNKSSSRSYMLATWLKNALEYYEEYALNGPEPYQKFSETKTSRVDTTEPNPSQNPTKDVISEFEDEIDKITKEIKKLSDTVNSHTEILNRSGTNLSQFESESGITIASSTGTDVTIPIANGYDAGLMSSQDKRNLDFLAEFAKIEEIR